ncbi:glycosyltransferase family 24 protein [Babjeviella inositovora NRRL Y-12698]|uniref:Glycosyltransferase family 24 protein n=1 Tax=Babjeviella inositovora NRRL Y-12698 TaxID=984486 RepID=A0A1E3QJX2_9ASCO|nr:glycosyltransferase family 24 protein [Babjeviella inositovora NRRL Y-12698]ODQ77983.1 glycosyltransferase family 24 protein [Babjeviella inositovora NRRL Y-12698]
MFSRWEHQCNSTIGGRTYKTVASANLVDVNLRATWRRTPFELNLLESAAAQNESLYEPLLAQIIGLDDEEAQFTHQELFESASALLAEMPAAMFEFQLANKYHSPRVQAHYQYYSNVVLPKHSAQLVSQCAVDSFGNKVGTKSGLPAAWMVLNNKIYCSSDEIFALRFDESSQEGLIATDRIMGKAGPIAIVYGDIASTKFRRMFRTIYSFVQQGKLRVVWRYIPDEKTVEKESLTGYGVDLTLKRTDYIVLDDRDFGQKILEVDTPEVESDVFWESYHKDIAPLKQTDIDSVDLRLASYILDGNYTLSQFEMLQTVVQDFPKFVSFFASYPVNPEVKKHAATNDEFGLDDTATGLYVNGAPILAAQLDVFRLFKVIEDEHNLVSQFSDFGLKPSQAKELIKKFAHMSTVMQAQRDRARYNIGKTPGVVFLNNIEKDKAYKPVSTNLEVYMQRFQMGQIPPLRENVHETIFAVNLSDQQTVAVVMKVYELMVGRKICQQIGVLPLVDSELDAQLTQQFYRLYEAGSKAKLLQFLKDISSGEANFDETELDITKYTQVRKQFSITNPSVIINGVFYALDGRFQQNIAAQIYQDTIELQHFLINEAQKAGGPGDLSAVKHGQLKQFLLRGLLQSRNLRVAPENMNVVQFKDIDKELVEAAVSAVRSDADGLPMASLWVVGDFDDESVRVQLANVLRFWITAGNENLQLRVLQTGDSKLFGLVETYLQSKKFSLTVEDVEILVETVESAESGYATGNVSELLVRNKLPSDKPFLLLSGRFISVGAEPLSVSDLEAWVSHDSENRLELIQSALVTLDLDFDLEKVTSQSSWFERLFALVTRSLFKDELFERFDFSKIDLYNQFTVIGDEESPITVTLLIDPLSEKAQEVIAMVNAVTKLPFVNLQILLQPKPKVEELAIKRLYRGVFPSGATFDETGKAVDAAKAVFDLVPEETLFTLNLITPSPWIVVIQEANTDLDNVKLSLAGGTVSGTYELKNILVEGYYTQDLSGPVHIPPAGLAVDLSPVGVTSAVSDTNVMATAGYMQLKANPGFYDLTIKKGTRSAEIYDLVSASEGFEEEGKIPVDSIQLRILNLKGLMVFPKVAKKPGFEDKSLDEPVPAAKKGFMGKLFKKSVESKQPEINIFTVASGHLYERFLGIMTASVMKHTKHTVKFWLIENYMSPHFKKVLPALAEKYGFKYELVNYKWPSWLRNQREKQRTIWGYKILFLDVLFPQDLEKVIFVDSDQIVRTDMKELVDMDLEGAPYGYTPMGDSREEMEGFRFWKQGYWAKLLGDEYLYHISALYVIDLKKFRAIGAGDKLRAHYQQLSADPNSLSNLDQDLPNNLQKELRIFSLPQDWLWCETWCSDESLKTAKTIDLCNNPLTKEPKLDRARRQIPEWTTYDDEITDMIKGLRLDEAVPAPVEEEEEEEEEQIDAGQDYDWDDLEHDEL